MINNILYRPLSYPMVHLSAKLGLTPNFITFISLLCAFIAAIFFGLGHVYLGALFFFLRHYFDCIDGALARLTKNFSKFGAMFDAVGDGVGVLAVLIAIAIEQYIRLGTSIVFLYLGLTLVSNFIGLFYHTSVKARYFKHLRAGLQNDELTAKTKHNSIVNSFGFDSDAEVKLNFLEKLVKKLTPFPNIEQKMIHNVDKHELSIEEKQTKFKDKLSFLPWMWSLMAGASQVTATTIVALFNRLDDVLWFTLIIGWNLLAIPFSIIHWITFKRFSTEK
ncbi:CDP-alcohol phosphatidyltransferase family protein [Candidatus Lokiarchaeum ossiferum]|uniref:CDP-alcohol phosphatidyltransferase family protein n=1 Tax=Candidatus Lokiarchaeum ossiferum TaxID=2951803 RepID=UPI00352FDF34